MELENIRAVSSDISTGPVAGAETTTHPEALESVLTSVRGQGWHVLRDLVDPVGQGQAVSFVLVGPGGVVVMETADRFSWRTRPQTFLAAAGGLAATLPAAHRTRVRSVLVLLGGAHDIVARCTVPAAIDTVNVAGLEQWLTAEPAALRAAEVESLALVVTEEWDGGRERLLNTADVPPQDACIPEATLRRGRRRGLARRIPRGARRPRPATVRSDTIRPDFTTTDLVRVVLATLAVLAVLCFLNYAGGGPDAGTGGTTGKTPVTSTVVDGTHGQSEPSTAQASAP